MSIDLSLDRIRQLLSHLPSYSRPTCHIAGTNGKGSVSALISSILMASSPPLRVGRFNSPHLVSICDSITINNDPITAITYADARARVENADMVHRIGATCFELLTSTALLILEEARVDIAVIEVGMGGRLDATNVIPDDCVLVSVLTAVDLDHQAFLGNTVVEIAREKSAIARKGKPFILGPQKYPEVQTAVEEVVRKLGGHQLNALVPMRRDWDQSIDGVFRPSVSFSPSSFSGPPPQPVETILPCFAEPLRALLPLQGECQLENLGTALTAVYALLTHPDRGLRLRERVTADTVARGIQSTTWPGRLSFHIVALPLRSSQGSEREQSTEEDFLVLADGAHNPSSSATLSGYLTHLLSLASADTPTNYTSGPHASERTITLTYLLALSHSPPKTPQQTLSPVLPPIIPSTFSGIRVNLNVAVLEFTPPDGMPWVKPVPPSELKQVVHSLVPEADVWSPRDEDSTEVQLRAALNWAAQKQKSSADEGLIIISGSLYLVADFYRLLPNALT